MYSKCLILTLIVLCFAHVQAIAVSKAKMRVERTQYRAMLQNVTDFITALEEKYEFSVENCTAELDYNIGIINKHFNTIINNKARKGGGKLTLSQAT